MKRIAKYFFEGMIFIVPIVASIYIVFIIFNKIDGLLRLDELLNRPVPGLGFLLTITLITLIGFLASNFLTKKLFGYLEALFARLPLIKLLYSSIKDLIGAFVGDKKSFDKPVLVTIVPGTEIKALGFITRDSLEFLGLKDQVSVYFPQSYNFAGNLMVVPRESVTPLAADSSEVMTFIVSGGVSGATGNESERIPMGK